MVRRRNRCVEKTEEPPFRLASSVPLTHHDPKNLGFICKKETHPNVFWCGGCQIFPEIKIYAWYFLYHLSFFTALASMYPFEWQTLRLSEMFH